MEQKQDAKQLADELRKLLEQMNKVVDALAKQDCVVEIEHHDHYVFGNILPSQYYSAIITKKFIL